MIMYQERTQRRSCRAVGPYPPPPEIFQNRYLKSTGFVDTISEVFRDLPFGLNQALKSADD
jgi:hypothetical protein